MVPASFSTSTTPSTYQGQMFGNPSNQGCSINWKRMTLECPQDSYDVLDQPIYEGFTGTAQSPGSTSKQSEVEQLHSLQDKFNKKLSKFTRIQNSLVDGARAFIDSTDKHNPFLNKNVRLSTGALGFVTSGAIFKPYPNSAIAEATMGRNGCPAEEVPATVPVDTRVVEGGNIPTTPAMLVGTPMSSGQPCSDYGRNVRVGVVDVGDSDFMGMYDFKPTTDNFVVQGDLKGDDSTIFSKCQQRAVDLGKSAFGLGHFLGPTGGLHCAVGPAPSGPPPKDSGLQSKVAWSKTFNHDISSFGLKPDASVFTVYGKDPMWTPAQRVGCAAGTGGSMISDVQSTFGANCNGTSPANSQ